jgi:hypothetical protein
MRTIYILEEDQDGTFWSGPKPTGQVVYTKEEAEKWIAEASWLGQRSYTETQEN